MDIIQPIQVAIHEMKFGLAMVTSDALEREYLTKVQEHNMERISVSLYDCVFHLFAPIKCLSLCIFLWNIGICNVTLTIFCMHMLFSYLQEPFSYS